MCRHQGADILQYIGENVPFYQNHHLDIVLFLMSILLVLVTVLVFTCKLLKNTLFEKIPLKKKTELKYADNYSISIIVIFLNIIVKCEVIKVNPQLSERDQAASQAASELVVG